MEIWMKVHKSQMCWIKILHLTISQPALRLDPHPSCPFSWVSYPFLDLPHRVHCQYLCRVISCPECVDVWGRRVIATTTESDPDPVVTGTLSGHLSFRFHFSKCCLAANVGHIVLASCVNFQLSAEHRKQKNTCSFAQHTWEWISL